MEEKRAEFSIKGQKLVGLLHLPDGNSPLPCVVCSHGYKANKDSEKYLQIGWRFSEKGIAVLRLDHRGALNGESDGKFEDTTLTSRVEDLQAALDYVASLKEIDSGRLGLIGSSLGGMDVLLVKDARVKAKVLMSTPFSFPRAPERLITALKEKGYYDYPDGSRIKRDFYEDIARYNMAEEARKETCPLLVIHGNLDEQVPRHHARVLYNSAGSQVKELHMIDGADHSFTDLAKLNEALILSLDWFQKYL